MFPLFALATRKLKAQLSIIVTVLAKGSFKRAVLRLPASEITWCAVHMDSGPHPRSGVDFLELGP